MQVWYQVKDLTAGRAFYTKQLGFRETFVDDDGRWVKLERGGMEIAIAEGEPDQDAGVATIDVDDVKAEAERLRGQGVEVGVVLELHGELRLLDVRPRGEPDPARGGARSRLVSAATLPRMRDCRCKSHFFASGRA